MAQLKNGSTIGGNTFTVGTILYTNEAGLVGVSGNANISGTLLLAGMNVKSTIETSFNQANTAFSYSTKIKRHTWIEPYSYCGIAPNGSLDTSNVWIISRITVNSNGSTSVATSSNVAWSNITTIDYV
jgi:hypothetical protein